MDREHVMLSDSRGFCPHFYAYTLPSHPTDNSQLKTLKAEIAKAHSMAAHPASKDVDSAKHNDTHSGKSEQAAKAAAKKEEAAAKKEKESTDTVLVIDQSPPGVKHGVHATPAGGIGKVRFG